MGSAAAVAGVGYQVVFVIRLERGDDRGKLHTLVTVQVGVASALASKRETVGVKWSLQGIRADRTKVDGAFRDMASRSRGGDPHG